MPKYSSSVLIKKILERIYFILTYSIHIIILKFILLFYLIVIIRVLFCRLVVKRRKLRTLFLSFFFKLDDIQL